MKKIIGIIFKRKLLISRNGKSLLARETEIKLALKSENELILACLTD